MVVGNIAKHHRIIISGKTKVTAGSILAGLLFAAHKVRHLVPIGMMKAAFASNHAEW